MPDERETSIRRLMEPEYASRRSMGEYDPEIMLARLGVDPKKLAFMGISDPFEPDDCTPEHVRAAAIASLNDGGAHYGSPTGSRELRVLIAEKYSAMSGMEIDPDRHITVAPGADPLLTFCLRPFLEPGARHEILTPAPAFNSNYEVGAIAGGVTVTVPTHPEDDFDLRIEEFQRRLTPRTKAVLITNPNNPTGRLYSRRALEQLAEFATANDLVVVSDQCFEDIVFDGEEMTHIAVLPGMAERTIVIGSMSKNMALCGYRIGYAIASDEVSNVLHSVVPHVFGTPNTVSQAAVVAGLRDPQFIEDYRREFMARAEAITEMLGAVPNIRFPKPQGGYFLWIDVSAYGDSESVAKYVLDEASVLINPGGAFGGGEYVRLVYSAFADRERCLDAVRRIVDALARHPANA